MPRAIPIRMLTAVYCGLVETKSDDEVEKKQTMLITIFLIRVFRFRSMRTGDVY